MNAIDTLVFFAARIEAQPLQRRLPPAAPVRICLCGIGQANARAAAARELAATPPALALTCGFAGGLDPQLAQGHVLLEAAPGFPLRARLLAAGCSPGTFCCTDRIVVSPEEKAALRAMTRADAVEMESEAIRLECARNGVPCATVRVISDTAHEALPLDFNRFADTQGNLSSARIAWALVRNPTRIGALIRFRRDLGHAASRLGEVLAAALQ